ncbi:ABC transporter ATP-binding protein [Dactylosporangium roseum]|uniref:ABC transporter ATP-binding protein n=1 Tax=Dactylosporangium roseum TaxID=47989 RepID=A0ABY5ZAI6_9ACTN|nr:ABC transporter ATP-binding protein [Dactylosporangium roseum]UWZ39096.1 ABC transporter ATP-binding protein [Dactylosporangium roseum]
MSTGTEPALRVADLHVRYGGSTAVRDVSFHIDGGEVFGLVGESGSGKSSVCAALMRLLPPGGSLRATAIEFGGRDLSRASERDMRAIRGKGIALVPQKPMTSLSPTTPVGRQLRWYLGERLDSAQTQQMLISIGLRAVLDRPGDLPSRFSGGQLQRLLIAIAALTHRPALLLADEPTTTLDATVQAQVLRLLLAVRAEVGSAMLYVTHDLAVIAQVADRIGVMYGGRLVEVAPVAELFAAPRHPYTRALIAAMPSAWIEGRPLRPIPGSAAGANRTDGCPFAPRCPHADTICQETMPTAVMAGAAMVRCHHAEVTV